MSDDNSDNKIKEELDEADKKLDEMETKMDKLEKEQAEDNKASEEVLGGIAKETEGALDKIEKEADEIGRVAGDDEKLEDIRKQL